MTAQPARPSISRTNASVVTCLQYPRLLRSAHSCRSALSVAQASVGTVTRYPRSHASRTAEVDALVGQHARDHQRPHAQVPQHVVDVGRDEHGRRRLRQHDLVLGRRDRVQHLRIPRTARHEQPADLVVEAQIAPVARQRLDHRVHHLDARVPARRLQPLHVRQRRLAHRAEEIPVSRVALGLGHRGIFAAIRPRIVVLHIDEQQRRVRRIDRHLAAQHDRRPTAAGSSRSNRAAHAA